MVYMASLLKSFIMFSRIRGQRIFPVGNTIC